MDANGDVVAGADVEGEAIDAELVDVRRRDAELAAAQKEEPARFDRFGQRIAALTPLLPHYADELGLGKTGAGVLAAACLASVVIWAAFGASIGRLLRRPRARRTFNWTMAGLLVLSLIPVFLQRLD